MDALVIGQRHIAELVGCYGRDLIMDRMIERLRTEFAKPASRRGSTPARAGFARNDDTAVLEWMPHHEPGAAVTIKTVSYSPDNPQRHGLPTITGILTRFDDRTGRLTAVSDGIFLTTIRTGAASAIASQLLARPDSTVLGLVGAGAQAVTQAHALSRLFPLTDILVHDVADPHAKSFPNRVEFLGINVRITSLAELEAAADIICTATSVEVGHGPVLGGANLRPHVHINGIGADLPGKFEIPVPVLRRAFIVPDHVEQARREGECQQLPDLDLDVTLLDLCARPELAHAQRNRLTVFDSTGFALEDHVALDTMLELATEAGIGERIFLEHLPVDALDPYACVS